MLDIKRVKEAESNVALYQKEGLLKKQKNETAKEMYIKNAELSLQTAQKIFSLESPDYQPYLWVIVVSYYSMFYIANAVLLEIGYKVGDRISHKIASDCLIVFIRQRLKKELLEDYESTKEEALEFISSKTDSIIGLLDLERAKRSNAQYQMSEDVKKKKAITSLNRAKEFVFEMKKLIQ
ncbi:MAG: hypothetical protein V1659_03390 [Candidatus Woesearchaeota archaeon]